MRTLVVLVECDGSEAVVPHAQKRAPDGPITVLQVLDPAYKEKLCRKLQQDGWMGASRSEELGQAIDDVYRQRFDESIDDVVAGLIEAGRTVDRVTRPGDLVNTTLRVAEEVGDVTLILVAQPRRSWLVRWFKDLNIRVLMDRAGCEVELVDLPRT